MKNKKVLIIFTGGTISMKNDEKTNAAIPAMTGEDILNLVPEIKDITTLEFINFGMMPGPHMTPDHMLELSILINHKIGKEDYDGIVVTHGTDSLEETAYFLDLTYDQKAPVIFVGSMKNSTEFGWDGPENLIAAVQTAINEDAEGRGVMVVMNNEIHSAAQVTKTKTHTIDTFKSKDFGPIGFVSRDKVHFYYSYTKRQYFKISKVVKDIDLIKCGCGMDDKFLRFSVDSGAKGIVVEGLGKGNIPPTMVSGIDYAIGKGIPVILVSRCIMGRAMDDYGYPGAGRDLTTRGVILGDNLPGQKARIKLMIALASTSRMEEIKDIFEKNYY